jgi:glycosyltransferase involved in cell wall biosynthesis
MNPLILNYFDITGGAARAAYRLHAGLRSIGVNSRMLVMFKHSDDPTVTMPPGRVRSRLNRFITKLDRLPLRAYPRRMHVPWGVGWIPTAIEQPAMRLEPDVVNLHWVSGGFVPLLSVSRFQAPLVWTFHDQWAFTGGCHYDQECGRYRVACGACPQLQSSDPDDLTRQVLLLKHKLWHNLDITIVTPSRWLAACAQSSALFRHQRIERIPYGLDLDRFRPMPRQAAREMLALPQDKKLILFGAMSSTSDQRKGFQYLQPALHGLAAQGWGTQAEAVIFGAARPEHDPDLGLPTHYTGRLHDDVSLALIYAAADVFVAPSVQDNLPNTVLESLACGTPVVAFDIGGMPDMIEHEQNGYIAPPFKTEELAHGIAWVLQDAARHERLCHRAREKAEQEWPLALQAQRYQALYAEVIAQFRLRTRQPQAEKGRKTR